MSNIYIGSFIRMPQIKVNFYCIATRKLKTYVFGYTWSPYWPINAKFRSEKR